jgi:hypothetical protein
MGLVMILGLLTVSPAQAQDDDLNYYFDQTRHNIQGEFWRFYQNVFEAETFLGYPITEQFVNQDGVLVQYFQRARLELGNGEVRLSPLGTLTYKTGVQLKIDNPLACRDYKTGDAVCFAFLQYFDEHGGLALLGYPISPFEYQDNRIVQYFQNGRLEWHPSNPEGQRVVMGNLGLAYNMANEDPARRDPVLPLDAGIRTQVLSLKVRAFPWKAVTYSTDQQLIFVVVQDQTLQPVQGAIGQAKITWTTGVEETLPILTDENGIATLPLSVVNQPYGGLVTIDVQISLGEQSGQTTTSFRIWY